MANHIHLHLDTKDAGTSEGARKAAQTRAQHGGRAGNTASSVGGVLKQHGYEPVMHQGSETFHKHPQHVSSVVTRGESWEHTGYGKGSGAATLNRHLSAHHATHAPASKSEVMKSRLETTNPVRRHSQDAGTSEGARKAAMHRKAHGYHKQQALAGKEGHGVAAALHQHAAMMHASPNPLYHGPKAEAASAKAISASRKLGYTVDAGTSEGARKAAQTRAQHGGTPKRGGFAAAVKQHEQHAYRHEASAARYRNTGNREAAQAHSSAAEAHYHAAHAYRSVNQGRPMNATLARRQATQATRATRFGAGDSGTKDAGTSEGARKAAITKQGGIAKTARRSFYPVSKTSAAPRGMAVSKRQSPSQKHYSFDPRKD